MRTNGEVAHDCAVESALRRMANALERIASALNKDGKEAENGEQEAR